MHPEAEVWKRKRDLCIMRRRRWTSCVLFQCLWRALLPLCRQTCRKASSTREKNECVCVCVFSHAAACAWKAFIFHSRRVFVLKLLICTICVFSPWKQRDLGWGRGLFLLLSEGVDDGISGWKEDEARRLLLLKFRSRVPPPSDVIKSSGGDEF